ncbi:hypothetical protein QJS10_CPB12g00858 [Acorus calamus]|uniref:Transposase MuDR plant domain-containing protein n=1 Tax=Acorus calamus TaxID=4465 RepID=A0AAV9DQZ5_ACOCL|nr:hypothetical protein QJS10_CPB12g00858 [Acorus calamus]
MCRNTTVTGEKRVCSDAVATTGKRPCGGGSSSCSLSIYTSLLPAQGTSQAEIPVELLAKVQVYEDMTLGICEDYIPSEFQVEDNVIADGTEINIELIVEHDDMAAHGIFEVEAEDDGEDSLFCEDFSEGIREEDIPREVDGLEEQHEKHHEMTDFMTDSDMSVGDYMGAVLQYDPEMPSMDVGSLFPNVTEFRNALRQHCILNEFKVHYIKNDKLFRIPNCPWRIHASVIQENVTFEVRTLVKDHSCTSINKVGNEMATSGWLASKIVSILHETPEVGASKIEILNREHRTCVRHLYKNFKKKHPGELLERLVWLCVNSYDLAAFEDYMREIRMASPSAAAYLDPMKDQRWSRHQFGTVTRSHYLTNNLSGRSCLDK